jgi:hypothetical protein
MLLTKLLRKNLKNRNELILAFKISIMVFFLVTLSLILLITINHFQSIIEEKKDFNDEINLLKLSSSFPKNIIDPRLNTKLSSIDKVKV